LPARGRCGRASARPRTAPQPARAPGSARSHRARASQWPPGLPVLLGAHPRSSLSPLLATRVGGGGGQVAKDALGNNVLASAWTKSHDAGARELVQGLKGDATYLIVKSDGTLESYGLNAVCTHLGCVVPWNTAENKFMCPCHGSQYNSEGKKIRGPAPLSLALAHLNITDDVVSFDTWTETDFRTGDKPWWS
jgi:cytochrome b6-f complex iron-sulfur subunit